MSKEIELTNFSAVLKTNTKQFVGIFRKDKRFFLVRNIEPFDEIDIKLSIDPGIVRTKDQVIGARKIISILLYRLGGRRNGIQIETL